MVMGAVLNFVLEIGMCGLVSNPLTLGLVRMVNGILLHLYLIERLFGSGPI